MTDKPKSCLRGCYWLAERPEDRHEPGCPNHKPTEPTAEPVSSCGCEVFEVVGIDPAMASMMDKIMKESRKVWDMIDKTMTEKPKQPTAEPVDHPELRGCTPSCRTLRRSHEDKIDDLRATIERLKAERDGLRATIERMESADRFPDPRFDIR